MRSSDRLGPPHWNQGAHSHPGRHDGDRAASRRLTPALVDMVFAPSLARDHAALYPGKSAPGGAPSYCARSNPATRPGGHIVKGHGMPRRFLALQTRWSGPCAYILVRVVNPVFKGRCCRGGPPYECPALTIFRVALIPRPGNHKNSLIATQGEVT